jgi:hypothetical protein
MNNIQIDNNTTVIEPIPSRCAIIDAEKVIIREKEIVITIDLAEDVLKQIDSIEINGFKFTKEN